MLLHSAEIEIGWRAADFALGDTDGNLISRYQVAGENGFVVAFICNHCPYVQALVERLATDAAAMLAMGIGVAAIMPNDFEEYPEDSPANMKKFAKQYNFKFPYLVDESQSVARAYGAVCTPDFFGFNRECELQYRGRLDDLTMGEMKGGNESRTPELLNAMKLIAESGVGPKKQNPSMGCSIKWKQ